MESIKYYFNVNNSYVVNKLSIVLCPFGHKNWSRLHLSESPGFKAPRDDVNAPDLYIPLMAFITYILAVGLALGYGNRFRPEALSGTASWGLATAAVEIVGLKLGLYLVAVNSIDLFDLLAYVSYKYLGITLSILTGIFLPFLYYPVLLYTTTAVAFFLLKTLGPLMFSVAGPGTSPEDKQRRNLFLFGVAAFQFPLCWLAIVRP